MHSYAPRQLCGIVRHMEFKAVQRELMLSAVRCKLAVLSEMEPKEGRVFDATNLRKEWEKACTLCGLGTQVQMDNGKNQWLRGPYAPANN
jgi:hypothetical protein